MPEFVLHRPQSVDEIVHLRVELGESAALYAGGTELLAAMKIGVVRYEHLIDVKRVRALSGIAYDSGVVRIGATTTHREIESDPIVIERLPALAKLERDVANVRVRAAGTLAGNLAFGEPHADPPALLLAMGTRIVVQGNDGRRSIDVDEFCVGAYQTSLGSDELIVGFDIPVPPPGSTATYEKFQVLERPSVGVAAVGKVSDGVFECAPQVVVAAVDETPHSVSTEMLTGTHITDESTMDEVCEAARAVVQPVDDLSGSREYKKHLVGVLTRRALLKLESNENLS